MLDNWRHGKATAASQLYLWLAALLVATCLLLWISMSPSPVEELAEKNYILLFENNSFRFPSPHRMFTLGSSDFTTLIDLEDFDFLINNFPCNDSISGRQHPLLLLVLIHSAPRNFKNRQTIRDTWGSQRDSASFRVLFLLGEVDSSDLQVSIEDESDIYRDVVQGRFVDSYRNMTYKHVMGLKWITYFCPDVRYVLKCDDDVFVNTPRLLGYLRNTLSAHGARRLILCSRFQFAYVKRSYRSKWRVSYKEYPHKLYPSYCAGWGVFYSPDVVFLLYQEAQRSPYFWIDDVHVTGTLAARVNVTHSHLISSLILDTEQVNSILNSPSQRNCSSDFGFLFAAPDFSMDVVSQLWKHVIECGVRRPAKATQ